MAHIIPGNLSTLGSVDLDRQVDIFKLAKMGESRCKRLWKDFADSEPASARVVITYVEKQQQTRDNAKNIVDGVLVKAKKPKKKKTFLAKGEKKVRKAAKAKSREPVPMEQKVYAMWGDSPDPVLREAARKIAGK